MFIRLPNDNPNAKHLFNVAVSVFYVIIVLNLWTGFLQLLFDVVGTYLIASNVKGSNMPWIVFAYVVVDVCIGILYSCFIPLFQVRHGSSHDEVCLLQEESNGY